MIVVTALAGCNTDAIHYDSMETEEVGRGPIPDLADLIIQPEDCTDEDGDGYGDGCALGKTTNLEGAPCVQRHETPRAPTLLRIIG